METENIDMALVMTVEPGFGAQQFMPDMMPKVRNSAWTHHSLDDATISWWCRSKFSAQNFRSSTSKLTAA
jgi:hypothetical protein